MRRQILLKAWVTGSVLGATLTLLLLSFLAYSIYSAEKSSFAYHVSMGTQSPDAVPPSFWGEVRKRGNGFFLGVSIVGLCGGLIGAGVGLVLTRGAKGLNYRQQDTPAVLFKASLCGIALGFALGLIIGIGFYEKVYYEAKVAFQEQVKAGKMRPEMMQSSMSGATCGAGNATVLFPLLLAGLGSIIGAGAGAAVQKEKARWQMR